MLSGKIVTDSINKAKELPPQVPQDNPQYLYYQIYNEEKNYKETPAKLEEYIGITDSIIYACGG